MVDNFPIMRSEAENAAILKVDFNLTNFHNLNYRSDEAFRAGNVRTFGLQLTPSSRPSTRIDRGNVYEYLSYQGISVLSDRYVHESGPNLTPDAQKAESYFWNSEKDCPTMICPTALFNHIDYDHLKAYEKIDFDLRSDVPKFISEFHIDKFIEALNQFRTETWISEQLVEID